MQNGDASIGETNTATVLPVKDKVLVSISGGEFGVRGHLTASGFSRSGFDDRRHESREFGGGPTMVL